MSEKTIGYIVQDGANGAVCHLGRAENRLFYGPKATVFASRREADSALRRTVRHWNASDTLSGLPLENHMLRIVRLVSR